MLKLIATCGIPKRPFGIPRDEVFDVVCELSYTEAAELGSKGLESLAADAVAALQDGYPNGYAGWELADADMSEMEEFPYYRRGCEPAFPGF